MHAPTIEQFEAALPHAQTLDQMIPAMRCHGFWINTGRGQIAISAEEGQQITDLVQRILRERCGQALGQTPSVLSADQRYMVESFQATNQDRQNFVQLMCHLAAGKPCTPAMSDLLAQLGDMVTFGAAA